MKKTRFLGIAALLAVVALALTFTACPEVADDVEREVEFINRSAAKIKISCPGSLPSSYTLNAAKSQADQNPDSIVVKRTGKDIELANIIIIDPEIEDPWTYIDISGSATAGKGKGNGIFLKEGTLIFSAAKGVEGGNILPYKIDVIPLDE